MADKKSTNLVSTDQKPYIRYEISGEVSSRGIAFTVKTAIQTFFKANRFEGKVCNFDSNNNSFSAVIEIYYNGRDDFNIQHLVEHINKSGRLPTKQEVRPEVSFRPLPCDYQMSEAPNSKNDEAWQKTVDGLNEKIKTTEKGITDREKTIKDLTHALDARQKVIGEKDASLKDLEEKVEQYKILADTQRTQVFKDPVMALIKSYLPQAFDNLIEISCDYERLMEFSKHRKESPELEFDERFTSLAQEILQSYLYPTDPDQHIYGLCLKKFAESGELTFTDYLGIVYHLSINSEKDIEEIKIRLGQTQSWKDTDESKELDKLYHQFNADQELWNTAKQSGASPEMIEALDSIFYTKDKNYQKILEKKTEQQIKFVNEQRLCQNIEGEKENYSVLMDLLQKHVQRKEAKDTLPVVVAPEYYPGEEKFRIRLYCPQLGGDNGFDEVMVNSLKEAVTTVTGVDYHLVKDNENKLVIESKLTEAKLILDRNILDKISDHVEKDKGYRFFGLSVKPVLVDCTK